MLIESDRQTRDDLRVWSELERADLVHGQSSALRRKIDKACGIISGFARDGVCHVSVSWGKDSVVAAHLALQICAIRLVWYRHDPYENPETERVRDRFLTAYPMADYLESHHNEYREVNESLGGRRITGIRADESGARKISARYHGYSTQASCRPLLDWSSADIFGYLACYQLPVHPNYAMLGGGRWARETIRVHSFDGEQGTQFGREEWEREYYGDVLRRLSRAGVSAGH